MHSDIFVAIGVLLAVSLLAAAAFEWIRIPKVTAYLLVGTFAGAHGLHLVSHETVNSLMPFADMAMALVLFNLGNQFPISKLGRLGRLLPLSIGEQVATFAIVAAGLWLITHNPTMSVLLGALALATAPATTVLVLKEVQSRGPVTELANGLVVLNNLVCILLFETLLVMFTGGGEQASGLFSSGMALCWKFSAAILLGGTAGMIVSYFSALVASKRWLVLVVAASACLLGLCNHLGYPYMLAFLTMGAVVASFSTEATALKTEIDNLTTLLCVVFFVYHGTEMDVFAFVNAGMLGAAYVAFRVIGKYTGIFGVAHLKKEAPDIRNWLGLTLMAQAGAAIALCTIAVKQSPELGRALQTIILGSVVFFEIAGPLAIRLAVIRAGEVPLSQAIYHASHTPMEQARELWSRIAAVFAPGKFNGRTIDQLKVTDLMRRSNSVTEDATFDLVIDHIEHSHDDIFPVVNSEGVPVGIIRYNAINNVLYDPHAADLVCAEDLMQPFDVSLRKSDDASRAIEHLLQTDDDCILVTDDEEPLPFLGVVRRSDITALLIQERKSASQGPANDTAKTVTDIKR